MNKSNDIARRLVKIAKDLVASNDDDESILESLKSKGVTGVKATGDSNIPNVLYTSFPAEYLDSIKENGLGAIVNENRKGGFFVSVDAGHSQEYASGMHGNRPVVTYEIQKSDIEGKLYYDCNDVYTATYVFGLSGLDNPGEFLACSDDLPDELVVDDIDSCQDNLCFYVDDVIPFSKLKKSTGAPDFDDDDDEPA